MSKQRPSEIKITLTLKNLPNAISFGWGDTAQPITLTNGKTGKQTQIGRVEAGICCNLSVIVEKQRQKERAVYCVNPLEIWDAVQEALKEKNKITRHE